MSGYTFAATGQTEDALSLAEKGFAVFPCDGKTPRVKWKDAATTDPDVIRAWWDQWPTANIGVALAPGTIAVDFDADLNTPEGVAAIEALGLSLPVSAFQRTPSGGGHAFYRTDGREAPQLVKRDGAPLDTRVGGKGYVVAWAPDEWVPADRWAEAPEWVYVRPEGPKPEAAAGDEPVVMTTHDEIVRWIGRIVANSKIKFTETQLLAIMQAAHHDGQIVASDPREPWTDADFRKIAEDAAEWQPGTSIVQPGNLIIDGLARIEVVTGDVTTGTVSALELESGPAPEMLVDGWLHPEETTIIYGKGGVGKGITSAHLAIELVRLGFRPYVLDFEDHPREWGSRLAAMDSPQERLRENIFHGAPYGRRWTAKKGPLIDIHDVVGEAMAQQGANYLIVDSYSTATRASDAMGGQESAIELSNAFSRLGTPALLLAHVAGGQQKHPDKPFGSVHVHNLVARRTWSTEAIGDEAADPNDPFSPHIVRLEFRNQKHNDGPRHPDRYLTFAFYRGGIRIEVTEERNVKRPVVDMIRDVLEETPGLDVPGVKARLRDRFPEEDTVNEDTIRKTLARWKGKPDGFVADASGKSYRWANLPRRA